MKNRTLFISSQCLNKQSQDFAYQQERLFLTQLTWQWSTNMIKVLWHRFRQCFDTFTMLLVQGSSATELLRHLSDYDFRVRSFGNTNLWGSSLFQKCSQKPRKSLFFSVNCIWIGIAKLSLLKTGYFSTPSSAF